MIVDTKHSYISFDGKVFNDEEVCRKYEDNYLTDEELIACFHFFHDKHVDKGDWDNAVRPGDATRYRFVIRRDDTEQIIELYREFKTTEWDVASWYTNLGFVIKRNMDFVVLYDAINGFTDRHYQGKATYNIKAFYEFFNALHPKRRVELPQ